MPPSLRVSDPEVVLSTKRGGLVSRRTLLVYFCAFLVVLVNSAAAVDRTWITGGGLNWNDADNWDPNDDFPDLADNAFFDADETYLTIVQSPSNVANVFFSDGNVSIAGGTLNVDDITSIDDADAVGPGDAAAVTVDGAIVDAGGDAVVGDAGFGTLTIETSGSFTTRNLFIGNGAGSTGEVNVDNATLTTDGPSSGHGYRIGQQGTGTLNVTGGGLVQIANDISGGIADFDLGVVAGASGTLNISGAGSSVVAEDALIGNGGVGTVMVSAGGLFDQNIFTSPDAFVGVQAGASGNVTVTGDNSRWNMRHLQLGERRVGVRWTCWRARLLTPAD